MSLSSIVLVFALAGARARADCYSHDGIAALDSRYYQGPELVSCGNGTSNCCFQVEKCGTNLLCAGTDGNIARQYCDNKEWNGCSTMCEGFTAAGVSLFDCGNNIYCCGAADSTCCTDDQLAFYVDPDDGSVTQTTEPAKTKAPRWFTVDSSAILAGSTTSSTTSSMPSSTSATQTPESSATESTATSASTSGFNTPAPTESSPSSSSSSSPSPSPSSISAGAGAGIGIGAAAGVALVSALVWFLLRRRKQKAAQGDMYEIPGHDAGGAIPPSANPYEKTGPPHSYYAYEGQAPAEMDGVQPQEVYGSADHGGHRYELDGGGKQREP